VFYTRIDLVAAGDFPHIRIRTPVRSLLQEFNIRLCTPSMCSGERSASRMTSSEHNGNEKAREKFTAIHLNVVASRRKLHKRREVPPSSGVQARERRRVDGAPRLSSAVSSDLGQPVKRA